MASAKDSLRKILVIDDSDDVRKFMRHLLVGSGYDVVAVGNGAMGKAALENASFDLIIVDLMLPDVHGFDLIKEIREADEEAKIVVVSGYAGCLEQSRLTQMGVRRVLPKPFKAAVLLETAHMLTGRQVELSELWTQIGTESEEKSVSRTDT